MNVIEITDLGDSRVAAYASLTEAQLRSRLNPGEAMIIVESPKVISTALAAGLVPLSLLCERRHIDGDAAAICKALGDVPVYTGSREVLERLTGYRLTRGVLCAMRRPVIPTAREICENSRRIGILVSVCDTTNIGTIFRSAAALGMDGLLLTADSCDPLNRRSIRVSMGTVFQIPWGIVERAEEVRGYGFETVAMALRDRSLDIADVRLKKVGKLALMFGTEGDGLPGAAIDGADWVVRIPMYNGVDSLNVGSAAAIAFHELALPGSGQG